MQWSEISIYCEKYLCTHFEPRDPDSSKQRAKTIDIQIISYSIDIDFTDRIFLHCQYKRRLDFPNRPVCFSKLKDLFYEAAIHIVVL